MMERKSITPRNRVEIEGKMAYNESIGAWNVIRFKAGLINEFQKLKEKRSKFSYRIVYPRDFDELDKMIKIIKMEKEGIPFLMFIYEDKV